MSNDEPQLPLPARIIQRFWELLDSETVRLFIWPFYSGLLAFGIAATILVPLDNPLANEMGVGHYKLWVAVLMAGTLSVMVGLALRHGGKPVAEMTERLLWIDWMGLCLQAGGHICVFWALLDFELAVIGLITWWTDSVTMFAAFALAPYVIGCVFLALQILRKLWHGEKLHRRTRGMNEGRGALNGPA